MDGDARGFAHDAIDLVTLKEELGRSGELDEVGGPAYISSLVDVVPRSTNVEHYARIIKEKATLRSLIYSANKILTNAYEAEDEADVILDQAEHAIFAIADKKVRDGFVSLKDLAEGSLDTIEKLHARGWRALVYTVNDAAVAERLIADGIDGIITDAVDRLGPGAMA